MERYLEGLPGGALTAGPSICIIRAGIRELNMNHHRMEKRIKLDGSFRKSYKHPPQFLQLVFDTFRY